MDQSKCKSDCQTFPDGRCRLALIGKTGSGKSSTGNTILSTDSAFEVGTGLNSQTQHGGYRYARVNDLLVEVLDTPGLADTNNEDMKLKEEIKKSIFCMHPGPHALLLVLRCNARFTPEDYQVFQSFKNIFGDELSSYTIVVFTGWDEMKCATDEFEIEIKKCKSLDKIMAEAGWRYLTFNNKGDEREKNEQVNRLIEKVKDLYSSNHFHFFRHNFTDQLEMSFSIMLNEEVKRAAAEVGGTHESMKELSIYTNGFKLKQMKDKTPELASVDSIGSHARQTSETDENVKTNYTKRMVQRFEANCISVPKMDPRVKRSTTDTKDRGNGNKEITAKLHDSEANRGNGNKDMTSKLHDSEADRGNGNTDMPAKLHDSEADRGNCNKDMTATLHDSEADRGNGNKDMTAKLHDSEADRGNGNTDMPAKLHDSEVDRGNCNKDMTAKLHDSEADRGNCNKDMTAKLHDSEADRGNGNTDMPAKLHDSEVDRGNCNKDMTAKLHDSEADRGHGNTDMPAKLHDSEADRGNGNTDMPAKLHDSEAERGNGNKDMPATLHDSEADRGNGNTDMPAKLHDSEADRGNGNKDMTAKLHDSEADRGNCNKDTSAKLHDSETDSEKSKNLLNTQIQVVQRKAKTQTDFKEQLQENIYTQSDTSNEAQQTKVTLRLNSEIILKDKIINHSETLSKSQRRQYRTSLGGLDDKVKDGFAKAKVKMIHQCKLM